MIIRKTFGKDYEKVCVLIDRIFSPDFELATQLRLNYKRLGKEWREVLEEVVLKVR